MDAKTRELIAIGASVTANCVPCLKYHYKEARQTGASDDEIREAIGVGRLVRKGAAVKWDDEAGTLFNMKPEAETVKTKCGCEDG